MQMHLVNSRLVLSTANVHKKKRTLTKCTQLSSITTCTKCKAFVHITEDSLLQKLLHLLNWNHLNICPLTLESIQAAFTTSQTAIVCQTLQWLTYNQYQENSRTCSNYQLGMCWFQFFGICPVPKSVRNWILQDIRWNICPEAVLDSMIYISLFYIPVIMQYRSLQLH